jgi:single-strand DNA-binding protein
VLWGAGAETLSKNTRKGARLFVSGRLSYRQWEDREGAKRYSTDIVIDEFIFLDSAPVAAGNGREVLVEPPF